MKHYVYLCLAASKHVSLNPQFHNYILTSHSLCYSFTSAITFTFLKLINRPICRKLRDNKSIHGHTRSYRLAS